jgi:hypothetical protein
VTDKPLEQHAFKLQNVKKVMDGLQLNSPENKNYTLVIVCVVDSLLKTHGIAFLPEKPAAPSSEATEAVAAPSASKKRASKKRAAAASKNVTVGAETNAAARLTLLEVQEGKGWLTDEDSVKYGARLKTLIVRAPINMFLLFE